MQINNHGLYLHVMFPSTLIGVAWVSIALGTRDGCQSSKVLRGNTASSAWGVCSWWAAHSWAPSHSSPALDDA